MITIEGDPSLEENIEVVEQPPVEIDLHNDDMKDNIGDMENMDTILEEPEPADGGKTAASSDQGASASPCLAPNCTLIAAPIFVVSFRNIWTR